MRIITVVGACPNFIKVAPLMPALLAAGHDAALAHTGQHYDAAMSDAIVAAAERALAKQPDWAIPERWDAEVSARVVKVLDRGLPQLRGA